MESLSRTADPNTFFNVSTASCIARRSITDEEEKTSKDSYLRVSFMMPYRTPSVLYSFNNFNSCLAGLDSGNFLNSFTIPSNVLNASCRYGSDLTINSSGETSPLYKTQLHFR